ncbi:MAG: DUF1080 domain-containing protein [Akkermansiaceae bacterium]|jgi:hypothetical protein|nr:DUF1080 domain-containing protein [Akkermansiaceae bacterium]
MKYGFLILLLTSFASALEWAKTFKPQKGWTTSTIAHADGKNIKTQNSGKPYFFTNASSPKKAGYLQTITKFGDCTVEAEFLIPKDSNSGIYLMGRYEIQILDSHGKETVGYGDMGGLYRRWDNSRDPKGFDGVAPLVNAANPAGEWQKMIIKFRAPRLAKDGKVLEHARFISVHLNNQLVQKNITAKGPTNSAQRSNWASKDHIFIQGDHGPIAFRKFKVTPEDFSKIKK